MLKRIYIDNFRCFSNFEHKPDQMNLLLGPNGVGKTSPFDVLRKLQALINDGAKVSDLFQPQTLNRRQTSRLQTFELDIAGNGGLYQYQLVIEHPTEPRKLAQVKREQLCHNDNFLVLFSEQKANLYRIENAEQATYPFNSNLSLVACMPENEGQALDHLTWFKERLGRFMIVQITPMVMENDSPQEAIHLDSQAQNFVSWYRHISQEDQGKALQVMQTLQEILDGFHGFKLIKSGENNRLLHISINGVDYDFTELSDGQRVLIVLYTLIYYTQSEDYTLCLDEPENFIALPEIQPWLIELSDLCGEDKLQAILISHHPELINYLANYAGYWLDRIDNGPVYVKRIEAQEEGGLPISELVARGWTNGF